MPTAVKLIKEINSGYIFKGKDLREALTSENDNAQREYYLTDVIGIMRNKGLKVGAFKTGDTEDIMGVNNRYQLSVANKIMQSRIQRSYAVRSDNY